MKPASYTLPCSKEFTSAQNAVLIHQKCMTTESNGSNISLSVIHLSFSAFVKDCHVCPCCGKRFFETIPFLPKYQRTSNALWAMALLELSKTASMKSIAERLNVSASTIARILDKVNYPCATLPPVISIDEFKGNTGGRKFQCILTNPKEKKVLDILPNRKSDDLYQYFSKFPDRNKRKIRCHGFKHTL